MLARAIFLFSAALLCACSDTPQRDPSAQPAIEAQAQRRFEKANLAVEAGQRELAEAELLWLLENYPQLSGPKLNLALLCSSSGRDEEAEILFQQALLINPENLAAHNQYAIFLRRHGRFAEAETQYLEALSVREDVADTHRNLGVLYDLYLGRQEKALQHFYRYQALMPERDRTVAGWIADLERQQTILAKGD